MRNRDTAHRDTVAFIATLALAAVVLLIPTAAKASFLDDGFGTGGKVNLSDRPNDVVVDRTGRTLVALNGGGSIVVAAYDDTGAPDTSFGDDGIAKVTLGNDATATALAVDPANRIVVGARHEGFRGAIVRLTPDGELDSAYDGDGVDFTNARVGGMLVQPDSKVVIAGIDEENFRFTRYTASGDRDTSFGGGDGVVAVDPQIPSHWGLSGGEVAMGPDGTLVAMANAVPAFQPNYVAVLAAVSSTGDVITSFGTSEVPGVSQDHSYGSAPSGVAIRPSGRIVFGASSLQIEGEPRNREAQVVGLIANGTRDPSWSSGSSVAGWAEAEIFGPDGDFRVTDMELMSNGRVVVAGIADASVAGSGDEVLAAARFLPNGELDPTFGVDGVAWADYPGPPGSVDAALAVDAFGRPVVAAARQTGPGLGDAVLVRFLPSGGTPDEGGAGGEGEGEGDVAGGVAGKGGRVGLQVHKIVVPKTAGALLRRGIRVLASCSEKCRLIVNVNVSGAIANSLGLSRTRIARGTSSAAANRRRWVVARLTPAAAEALGSYRGGGRLQVRVRAVGAAGAQSATAMVAG